MMEPALPTYLLEVLVVLAALLTVTLAVLSALFERSGHIRLHHWAEQAGGALHKTYEQPRYFEGFRFLISLFARLMPVLYVWALWALLASFELRSAAWVAPLFVVLSLFFVEWLNRFLVKVHSEEALRWMTPVYRVLHVLLNPILFVMAPLVRFAEEQDEEANEADPTLITEDEIDAFIDVGKREGILEEDHEDLVRSVVDFVETEVYSVMTPRVEINAMSVDASHEELAEKFFQSKNSRLPLFRESIDQIVGILHIRDLFASLQSLKAGQKPPAAIELCQQPHYVPETKKLRDLLEEMRALHQQMAIVVDDYGGVAGLVTIEDLVEEIVGDIRDEHEAKPDVRELLEDGRWRLTGRTYLADLNELLDVDLDLDSLEYETISGLVCGELGYVPKVGEHLETHGLILTVDGADDRRVTLVTVARAQAADSNDADTESA